MRKTLIVFLLTTKLVQLMGHYDDHSPVFYGIRIGDTSIPQNVETYEDRLLRKVPEEYRYFFIDFPYEYDWAYLLAIVHTESRWTETAVSSPNWNGSQDVGMLQINDRYVKYFVEKYGFSYFDPFNGHHSLELAAAHLDFLYRNTDNVEDAVVAYNIGLSAFKQGRRPESGRQYLHKVRRHLYEGN